MQRPVSTALTALGIGLVVAVFIGMLALANGFRSALLRTGSDANVLVLRRGADSELSSGIDRASRQHPRRLAPHRHRQRRQTAGESRGVRADTLVATGGGHQRGGQRRGARRGGAGVEGPKQHPDRRGAAAAVGPLRGLRRPEDGRYGFPIPTSVRPSASADGTGRWSATSRRAARRSSPRSGARTSSSCRCSGATCSSR